jgi:heterodisulfide reductase subunit A-like polyferredoxin
MKGANNMAFWNKAKVRHYARNPKTGKMQKVSQSVLSGKGADAAKALEAAGMNVKPTKLGNIREQQRLVHAQEMAKIAGRTTNIANAITQAGITTNKLIGDFKPVQSNVANVSQVEALVNGGAQSASGSRDDDSNDSEWVA